MNKYLNKYNLIISEFPEYQNNIMIVKLKNIMIFLLVLIDNEIRIHTIKGMAITNIGLY